MLLTIFTTINTGIITMGTKQEQVIANLVAAKESAEKIFQHMLELGLIKSWYYNGKFHVELPYDDRKPKDAFPVGLLKCYDGLVGVNEYPYEDFPMTMTEAIRHKHMMENYRPSKEALEHAEKLNEEYQKLVRMDGVMMDGLVRLISDS